jgi:hypothetical protein
MKTIFETGFRPEPWSPGLGVTVEQFFREIVQEAPEVYKTYEERKAEEAKAEAAKAQAEAEKARAAIITAQAPPTAAEPGKILGIPWPYLAIGGAGLALIALIAAAARK